MEWQKLHTVFHHELLDQVYALARQDPRILQNETIRMIKNEKTQTSMDQKYAVDFGVYQHWTAESPDWMRLLTNLYWRMYRQATAWALFCHLLHQDMASLSCLTPSMNLLQVSAHTENVTRLLYCFPFVRMLFEHPFALNIPCQNAYFYADIDWLATVISRHGAKIPDLIAEIEASKIIGNIDQDKYFQCTSSLFPKMKIHKRERDNEDRDSGWDTDDTNEIFGFWLPHGLSKQQNLRQLELQNLIKRANDAMLSYNDTVWNSTAVLMVSLGSLKTAGAPAVELLSGESLLPDVDGGRREYEDHVWNCWN
ncbi:hypothetical protein N7493_006583 [Penicillium malachiteum]|uniref:Uncharacterized protein n=1 Tax=Penicillium malachiteum TaxID=1324776 RepID=A0AAD6HKX1_9EURO|nr:hypothetical protein N7493_006583 [Penicillium malachiteum]